MKKDNKLYWKTATEPVENIVVRLVLATYADNDNLYVGLEKISGESPECWETYTDITVNCNALPSFHAYVDIRDCTLPFSIPIPFPKRISGGNSSPNPKSG